jgi:site-specific recombinase XerD
MIDDKISPVRLSQERLQKLLGEYAGVCAGSYSTRIARRRMLSEFIKFHSYAYDFAFTAEDADKYKKHLAINKKLSENSLKSYFSAFRKFCDFLREKGILDKNPARRISIKSNNIRAATAEYLTRNESDRLLESCDDTPLGLRDGIIILLIIYYDFKYSDLINLNCGDIRQKANFITLAGREIRTKHSIYINNYFTALSDTDPSAPLLISISRRSAGARITRRGLSDAIKRRMRHSGIGKSPRALSATAIINYARKVRSKKKIMEKYGIKLAETAGRYLEAARNY